MASRIALLTLVLAACAPLAGCVQDDGTRFNPLRQLTHTSDDDERQMGYDFDKELRKHVTVIDDPVVTGFVNDLGQEIVRTIEPQPFIYHFRVIADPSLNAFAVPGGYVYLHSGTVLAAGSVDELAGVLGHEIAHVKAHHYARMKAKSEIPDILVGLAGMAAAVATKEPGLAVASQAANVAVKLRYSREFEAEADELGAIFMTRAGYDPAGMTRFFERVVDEEELHPQEIPPYLYSHPDVKDRIDTVKRQAAKLHPTRAPDANLPEEMSDAQAHLAYLLDHRRDTVPPPTPPRDPHRVDGLLQAANDKAQEGRLDEALIVLSRAESLEPHDPRVPFRIGELLAAAGRNREAVQAYRRTVRLDPTRALVFYKLGLAHEAVGDRTSAVQAFEQASRRAGEGSSLREHADWKIQTLIFPVLLDAGFADGAKDGTDTPLGHTRVQFPEGTRRLLWWARLSSRYSGYPDHMRVVWRDPSGTVVGETKVERVARPYVASELDLDAPGATPTGSWTVEVHYGDDVIERRKLAIQPST